MGKYRELNFLSKLKLILYTLSFTSYSQELSKQGCIFLNLINNVEVLGMRKTFYYFFINMLLISCGEVSFNGHYCSHWKDQEISKTICCPKPHIKKDQKRGFQQKRRWINNRMWIAINDIPFFFIALSEQVDIHFLKSRRDAALQSFSTICW